MAIDRIECLTLDTIPPGITSEQQSQLNILRQVAIHPDIFRLVFFHLPADTRLHAKHALINLWQSEYNVLSLNIAEFTRQLIQAIHNGKWLEDMDRYQEPEILLVDDWQLITGRDSTQEYFYVSVLKPRLEKKLLTIIFSEQGYTELCPALRDDLRNLLKLGFHDLD